MFDSINDSNFVLDIDSKKMFITFMTSTDKKITKAIANFVHDCQITQNIINICSCMSSDSKPFINPFASLFTNVLVCECV